jgi:HlyD family secretion protein
MSVEQLSSVEVASKCGVQPALRDVARIAVGTEQLHPRKAEGLEGRAGLAVAPRSRRGLMLAAGAVLLLALAASGWWFVQRAPAVRYVTVAVTRGSVARTITATGTVNPELTIIVGSYVSGVIQSMHCDYNTRVKRGQLCAKIDPRPYQAALEQARGQLARDTGQLEGARADLARYRELRQEDSVAVQTYEDQQALVHQLEGSVQIDRAAVQNAEVNLGYTDIVSPVDGTVVARNITIGQTVAASFQTPTLFLIATDLTKMQVDTNVSESDIGAVKTGNEARFSVEAFDRPFYGTVVQVRQAPQTVQNVVTYDVVVAVNNSAFMLKPGMTATVSIVTEQRANALRVPDQALRFVPSGVSAPKPSATNTRMPAGNGVGPGQLGSEQRSARARVWVLSNGRPVPVELTTGLDDDANTEVISGKLAPATQVIVGEQRGAGGAAATSAPVRFGL